MSKDPNRVQRYRLTAEFTLKDRGDYSMVRRLFEAQFSKWNLFPGFLGDYLAIEKVKPSKDTTP